MPNILTVRSDLPGQRRTTKVVVEGSPLELEAPDLLILIHGYNNSVEKAQSSYSRFKDALRSATRPGGETRLGAVWEFHWPSDHPLGAISLATYPVRVPEAELVGVLLADFLTSRRPTQTIRIVAHSLGCRVALHAISAIQTSGRTTGPRIESLFLLAAAVPVTLCANEPGRPYPRPLPGVSEYAFYSNRDRVLQMSFVPGQYLAGETGEAVGRQGAPAYRWTSTMDTLLQHKQYWGSAEVVRRIDTLVWIQPVRWIGQARLPENDPTGEPRYLEKRERAVRNPF